MAVALEEGRKEGHGPAAALQTAYPVPSAHFKSRVSEAARKEWPSLAASIWPAVKRKSIVMTSAGTGDGGK